MPERYFEDDNDYAIDRTENIQLPDNYARIQFRNAEPGNEKKSLWTGGIVVGAVRDSFLKLNPRTLMKNPVMFVVEVGAVITTYDLIRDQIQHLGGFGFELQITLWLWFTVLFANFAEAMAEGRGKAQADTLRKARAETDGEAHRQDGRSRKITGSKLRTGDRVRVRRANSSRRRRSSGRRGLGG